MNVDIFSLFFFGPVHCRKLRAKCLNQKKFKWDTQPIFRCRRCRYAYATKAIFPEKGMWGAWTFRFSDGVACFFAMLLRIWCTYGAPAVLSWCSCSDFLAHFLWSKFDLCPGMGKDSLAICMSKKTQRKWSAEEQCEWRGTSHPGCHICCFWSLNNDIVGSSCCAKHRLKRSQLAILRKSGPWALENLLLSLVFAWSGHCWKTYGNTCLHKTTASDC